MSARVGVLVVHGMGSQRSPAFADDFIAAVNRELESSGVGRGQVAILPGFWADILDGPENELLRRFKLGGSDFGWPAALRKFVVQAVGDVAGYRSQPVASGSAYRSTYDKVHDRIAQALLTLRGMVESELSPLVLIGHSLGSVILSDHVWDEEAGPGYGKDPFTKCQTLAGMVTFGSTLPLFALEGEPIRPIRFPGRKLSPALTEAAYWLNVYSRYDVLGYPLRPTAYGYEHTVSEDREMLVGDWTTFWNPGSHMGYWDSRKFRKAVAEVVQSVAIAA